MGFDISQKEAASQHSTTVCLTCGQKVKPRAVPKPRRLSRGLTKSEMEKALLTGGKREIKTPVRYSPSASEMEDDASDCWENISLDSWGSDHGDVKEQGLDQPDVVAISDDD